MLQHPRRSNPGTLTAVAAASLLSLSLAACGRHDADNTINGVAADTSAAVDRVATKAEDALANASDKAAAAAQNVVADTRDALHDAGPKAKAAIDKVGHDADRAASDAKPKADALTHKAERGLDQLASATGEAAKKAGRAISDAGDKTVRSVDRHTTRDERSSERDAERP